MESIEEQLDYMRSKIQEIEKNLNILNENFMVLGEQIKETQRFLIKLGHTQSEIAKRVSSWPYIATKH